MVGTIGRLCAIWDYLVITFVDAMGLWREQSTALSAACGRGSEDAKQAGKEARESLLMAAEPSS